MSTENNTKAKGSTKRPGRPKTKKAVEPETKQVEPKQVEPKPPKAVKLSTIIKVAAAATAAAIGINRAKAAGYRTGYDDGFHAAEEEYEYDDDDDDSEEEEDE